MRTIKTIPQDIKAERAMLGSMLLDKEVIDYTTLKAEDFYNQAYSIIFTSIVDMNAEGIEVDAITLMDNVPELTVGLYHELTTEGMRTNNYKHWQEIIIKKSKLRKYIEIMQTSLELAFEGNDPTDNLRALEDIETKNETDMKHISEDVHKAVEHIEESQTKTGYEGITTGLHLLDYKLDGFKNKSSYILAARPSLGKTALALQIANSAAKQNYKVAIFSLEMGADELCKRLIVSESQVHLNLIKDKKLETNEYKRINLAAEKIHRRNIYVSDEFDQTISSIYRQAKKLKKRKGVDLIIIDYLQLLKPDGKFTSKNEEVGHNSRWLKKMAKNLDVPVICLSQLSRACESRPGNKPILSDLRDSGNIEQDADTVMFLFREDYYHKDEDNYTPNNEAEIIISKNRGGETGTIRSRWNGGMQTFYNK